MAFGQYAASISIAPRRTGSSPFPHGLERSLAIVNWADSISVSTGQNWSVLTAQSSLGWGGCQYSIQIANYSQNQRSQTRSLIPENQNQTQNKSQNEWGVIPSSWHHPPFFSSIFKSDFLRRIRRGFGDASAPPSYPPQPNQPSATVPA